MTEQPAFPPRSGVSQPGVPQPGPHQPGPAGSPAGQPGVLQFGTPAPPGAPQPGGPWPSAGIRPGWQPRPPEHSPSGLFPASPPPPHTHPIYREPHPAQLAGIFAGAGSAAVWLLTFGLLGRDLRGYVLWTLLAGAVAWPVALLLTTRGNRGVGTGIALASAVGWAIAATALAVRWYVTTDWPLW